LAIKNAIDNNELVVIHGDRFANDAPYMETNLMGHQAKFPNGPYYLAARFNKPVSFVFAFKETAKHYHFYASPPKKYPKIKSIADRKIISGNILKDYIPYLEDKIKKYPYQWFNFYDFWDRK
ncbi:MAG: lipid A biosynthesis acyltransferase, partial [Bacteroidales bacterium]|nr:lipid A biosynthesis acyltransferase [Bacteroidales bacterium]